MPAGSVALADLKAAVKAVLALVPLSGRIETRRGASPTWVTNARPKQVLWEITVAAIEERGTTAGTYAAEFPRVRMEAWMPFSYADNTEATWDTLLDGARTTLRQYPTLGGAVLGLTGSGLPQLRLNELGPYSDELRDLIVHHAVFELELRRDFTYTTSATLP